MHRKQLTLLVCAALVAMTVGFQASAEKMILENGDEVDVDVIGESNGVTTIEHPQLGRIEVPSASISPPPPKPIAPGLFGTSVLRGWDKKIGFGFSGASGVSRDLSLNASLSVKREADTYRGNFGAGYFFSKAAADQTTDVVNTSNEAFVKYEHDFVIAKSRWFVFVAGRYDYNEFQASVDAIAFAVREHYDELKRFTPEMSEAALEEE